MDVATKLIDANDIKHGLATVDVDMCGNIQSLQRVPEIVPTPTADLETKLTDRFDSTKYYTS